MKHLKLNKPGWRNNLSNDLFFVCLFVRTLFLERGRATDLKFGRGCSLILEGASVNHTYF